MKIFSVVTLACSTEACRFGSGVANVTHTQLHHRSFDLAQLEIKPAYLVIYDSNDNSDTIKLVCQTTQNQKNKQLATVSKFFSSERKTQQQRNSSSHSIH